MSWQATAWAARQVTGSPARKVLLLILANYCDEGGKCWPSQDTLSRCTEQSIDTVQRQLRRLEDSGLLSIRREPKRRGQWQGFVYQLHLDQEASTRPQNAARPRLPAERVNQADLVDEDRSDVRSGQAATSPPTRPQALRHKPSIEHSSEPSAKNLQVSAADRLQAFRGKRDGDEVVQNRIAQRLGSDGWLVLGAFTDAQRAKLTNLERRGDLTDERLAAAKLDARCPQPP